MCAYINIHVRVYIYTHVETIISYIYTHAANIVHIYIYIHTFYHYVDHTSFYVKKYTNQHMQFCCSNLCVRSFKYR